MHVNVVLVKRWSLDAGGGFTTSYWVQKLSNQVTSLVYLSYPDTFGQVSSENMPDK